MKPQIILVDYDDKEIGAIDHSQLSKNNIFRVSALWLKDKNGNVLIAQRKFNKKTDPGKWGPAAAGTVEVGETYESNIYKEAKEEIDLSKVDFQLGPHQVVRGERSFHCQWFIGLVDREYNFLLQEEEVESVLWISPKQLKADLQENPEKYLNSMATSARLFGI